ncbi:endonuclease 2-like isoform X2 [Oryza brachyantha]|uniref:endonuclease 2-like isoform X2 n=1 Tax=Oryza brachyantha TaxID=4533 RepID=UPI000776563D|nr:endonuclease 2-like isoform X2 [Oryza brachyantha]
MPLAAAPPLRLRRPPLVAVVVVVVVFFFLAAAPRRADAWGKQGHIIVCKITEKYLSEKAAAAVQELLPESAGGELSAVCPWADTVRFRYRWSRPLHYANTPQLCNFKFSRDCHNSRHQQGMCVVGAINNYTDQLYSYGDSKSSYNLTESLMFLAHFVGDVHQPLHVGFEEDEGGNTIHVHWYRRKENLHHVWDNSIIETTMKDFYNRSLDTMVEALKMNLTDGWSDDISHWENCANKKATCANDYAIESIHLSCNYAYKDVEQNITLGDDYFFSRYPIVEQRLAQAGIRLALILNQIFGEDKANANVIPLQSQ